MTMRDDGAVERTFDRSLEMVSDAQRRLLVLCALRVDERGPDWHVLAREVQRHRGPERLWHGEVTEGSKAARDTQEVLRAGLDRDVERAESRVVNELDAAGRVGARLLTVLDDDYPAGLRLVPDRPPFLFVRGAMTDEDARAVAVVGTRRATDKGLARATQMARLLSADGVTVVSGLAAGIDTAAHRGALDSGGRTLAVLGTGITRCYPEDNAGLAEDIADGHGALVSQFWPTSPPTSYSFPRRNHTTSGISQGTVVIEASSTSGAKMQARIALEHGKRVWLLRSLVEDQQWARKYADERGARRIEGVEEVVRELADPERVAEAGRASQQLTLEIL